MIQPVIYIYQESQKGSYYSSEYDNEANKIPKQPDTS